MPDQRDVAQLRIGPHPARGLDAIHVPHGRVHHDRRRPMPSRLLEPLGAAGGRHHVESGQLQGQRHHLTSCHVVIDDEDRRSRHCQRPPVVDPQAEKTLSRLRQPCDDDRSLQ